MEPIDVEEEVKVKIVQQKAIPVETIALIAYSIFAGSFLDYFFGWNPIQLGSIMLFVMYCRDTPLPRMLGGEKPQEIVSSVIHWITDKLEYLAIVSKGATIVIGERLKDLATKGGQNQVTRSRTIE